jgi:hypothetical protein
VELFEQVLEHKVPSCVLKQIHVQIFTHVILALLQRQLHSGTADLDFSILIIIHNDVSIHINILTQYENNDLFCITHGDGGDAHCGNNGTKHKLILKKMLLSYFR